MIARIWHGRTEKVKSVAYSEFLEAVAIPDYERTPGFQGLTFMRRSEGDTTHFTLLTLWENWEAIKRFAGGDFEKAKYYPEDQGFLLEFEETVTHYEVFGYQTLAH